MASEGPEPEDGVYHTGTGTPVLALKQAVCFYCWDETSNLSRCNACKSFQYCSKRCQKRDWKRNHKNICKHVVAVRSMYGPVPAAGRTWEEFHREDWNRYNTIIPNMGIGDLKNLVNWEPYCSHCYRRESQLEGGTKLAACPHCRLAAFCPSCPHAHPSPECTSLQDCVQFEKVLIGLHREKRAWTSIITPTPKKQDEYVPLSCALDWYDYYTRFAGWTEVADSMSRDLKALTDDSDERQLIHNMRYGTKVTVIQLTLLAALEATIPDIRTRSSITIHLIGVDYKETTCINAFEELLHFLPSLIALHISFVGLDPVMDALPQGQQSHQCCRGCDKMGRSIKWNAWKGPYHEYIDTESYNIPDLAAAFNSGWAVAFKKDWFPTIQHLAYAPHPTMFTGFDPEEVRAEVIVLDALDAELLTGPEDNKWKSVCPELKQGCMAQKPNEVHYRNDLWYIVKQRSAKEKEDSKVEPDHPVYSIDWYYDWELDT